MDPGSMFIAATALQSVGSLAGGFGQASQLDQQARATDYNAGIADMQADQAYAAGVARENQQRRQAAQVLGESRAALGESGFDSSSGSALDIQLQNVRNAELDALQIRYEGVLQGQGYESQAAMDRYTAQTLRASAKNTRRAAFVSAAAGALMGGASYGKLFGAPAAAASGAGSGLSLGGGIGLRAPTTGYWRG